MTTMELSLASIAPLPVQVTDLPRDVSRNCKETSQFSQGTPGSPQSHWCLNLTELRNHE